MTTLRFKPGKISRSSGTWNDEEYDAFADGKLVGRIYEDASTSAPPELRWGWWITANVPATPGVTHGTVATREEAKTKFREAWEKAGAQFEISIDGTPSTYGDLRPLAIEAAELLKRKHPHRAVVVKDLQTGETIAVEYKPRRM
jgi:hypothetical protein